MPVRTARSNPVADPARVPDSAPAWLKSLVARAARGEDPAHATREAVRCLTVFFGAVALVVWQENGGVREPVTPTTDGDWRRMLQRALNALRRKRTAAHAEGLLGVFAAGRHRRWMAQTEQPEGEDLEGVLSDWVSACGEFFTHYRLVGPGAVLQAADVRVDLHPYVMLGDCPDCDATGQLLFACGVQQDGRLIWRNAHNGHCVPGPAVAPAIAPPLPAAAFPSFASDSDKKTPEHVLERLRRWMGDSDRGYSIVTGPEGVGKSWLVRFIASDARFGPVACARADVNAGPTALWLPWFDAALREQPGPCLLPSPEFARSLASAGAPPEHQMHSYLSALVSLNGAPLVVVVDDADRWPESASCWPADLPAGVFVVLLAGDGGALSKRLAAMEEHGALRVRLSPDDPAYADLLHRWAAHAAPGAASTLLSCRLRQQAEAHGTPPAAGTAVDWLIAAWGRSAVETWMLAPLLRLASLPDGMPVSVLHDTSGDDACRELFSRAAWMLTADHGLVRLAHESLARQLQGQYPEQYRDVCRQLAWWAQDTLRHGRPDSETWCHARRNLWHWVAESGNTVLTARIAGLLAGRRDLPADPLEALRLVTRWHDLLVPSRVPLEEVLDVALLKVGALHRMGAWDETWQQAGHLVSRLTEVLRDGHASARPLLARSLVLRAMAAVHRDMAPQAADDCRRALDLYEQEQAHPDRTVEPLRLAEARWTLGRAVSQTEGAAAAILPMEQALSLYSAWDSGELPDVFADMASLYLRTSRPADAEVCCTLALERLEGRPDLEAACLARRGLIRSSMGRAEEALEDAEEAVQLYMVLLQGGRLELAADAAQACFDLAVLWCSQGDAEEAQEAISEAIRLASEVVDAYGQHGSRPLLARAHTRRALLRARAGDVDGAVQDCTRAIDIGGVLLERERRAHLRSDLAQAYNNRALAFARRGDAARALRDYQEAAAHYELLVGRQRLPEFRHHLALVHYNRAGLHRQERDVASARRDYTQAIDLLTEVLHDQDSVEVRRDLAAALANRGLAASLAGEEASPLQDYAQAIHILADLRAAGFHGVGDDLAAALHGRGLAYARLQRWPEAVSDYEAAEAGASPDAPARVAAMADRGRAHLAMERPDAAEADFRKVLALSPALPSAWSGLGRALEAQGQEGEARTACERSIELLEQVPALNRGAAWYEEAALARCARAVGTDLDDAVALADLAVRRLRGGPWVATVRNARGWEWLKADRAEDVVEDATMTLHLLGRLSPDRAESERLLGETLALRGRALFLLDRPNEAIPDFTGAVEAWTRVVEMRHAPPDALELGRVYLARATAERATGAMRDAICDLGWAVDLFRESIRQGRTACRPDLADACVARGYALLDAERFMEALADFEEAVRMGARQSELAAAIEVCRSGEGVPA